MSADSPAITRVDNTDLVLAIAASIIDHSGALTTLLTHKPPQAYAGRRRGPKRRLPIYPPRLMLVCVMELVYRAISVITADDMLDAIWSRYTEAQFAALGYPGWRDAARQRDMGKAPGQQHDNLSPAERKLHRDTWHAEKKRLAEQFAALLEAIETTYGHAGRRHSKETIEEWQSDPIYIERERLSHALVNQIAIRGSLYALQKRFHPTADPDDLSTGVLKGFAGDLGADEHICVTTSGLGGKRTIPVRQTTRLTAFTRQYKAAEAFGLTVVVGMSRVGTPILPSLALGVNIGAPSKGSGPAVLRSLQSMIDFGIRPERRGRSRHYIAFDMGYPGADGLNASLIDMGFSTLVTYPEHWTQGIDLSHSVHLSEKRKTALGLDDAPGGAGPYLFNGCITCPAAKRTIDHLLERVPTDGKRRKPHVRPRWEPPIPVLSSDGSLVRRHDWQNAVLSAAAMPLNGRPTPVVNAKPGRPSKSAKSAESVEGSYRVQVSCPAASGRARCSRVPASMDLPGDLPTFERHPSGPMPTVCLVDQVSIIMDADTLKRWQPLMSGTWAHEDLHSAYRSDTERFFSTLVSPSGGDHSMYKFSAYKNSLNMLFAACTIAVTNYKNYERFVENHAFDRTPGEPLTFPDRSKTKQTRDRETLLARLQQPAA